jgi:lysophospholipase L1-like esterase
MSLFTNSRRTALTLTGVIAFSGVAALTPASARNMTSAPLPTLTPTRPISWLSLGDSYGAGEGATEASGYCQRSPNAAGPKAATVLREERGWTIEPEAFGACTGYLAEDLLNSRRDLVTAGRDLYGKPIEAPADSEVPSDQSLETWAEGQVPGGTKFDVVVASLGGNDIGFADIVKACIDITRTLIHVGNAVIPSVTGSPWEAFARAVVADRVADHVDPEGCGPVGDELEGRVDDLISGSRSGRGLVDMYRDAADELLAPGGVFVVLGYPRLTTPSSDWQQWRGNQCNMLSRGDSDRLGKAAEYFDEQLRAAVEGIDGRFAYVSRLDVFDDGGNYHSLCSRGVEWLNTPLVFLRDGTLRPQRGFHPNDLGYLASAEAVAGVVDQQVGTAAPPDATSPATVAAIPTVPTPPPTIRSDEQHFDVGDPFTGTCTVAWPSAPARGVSSVTIRTTCPGVPAQFLFVDITIDDPDLAVTPSHPTVAVEGVVADISRSEFGFTVLVVYASSATVR